MKGNMERFAKQFHRNRGFECQKFTMSLVRIKTRHEFLVDVRRITL